MSPTLLVTGATGFLGRPCARRLVEQGMSVVGVARKACPTRYPGDCRVLHVDLLDRTQTRKIIRSTRPTHLLACAWAPSPDRAEDSIDHQAWVEATAALLEDFAEAGGERAVIAGTAAEYDWTIESTLHEATTPLNPPTEFGHAKHDLFQRVCELTQRAKLSVAWARLFWLYGTGEQPSRFVPTATRAVLAGEEITLSGANYERDYLHIDDAADAVARVLLSNHTGPINIASGRSISRRAIVETLENETGRQGLIQWTTPEQEEPASIVAEVTHLRIGLGFRPTVPLAVGLRRALAWWRHRQAA